MLVSYTSSANDDLGKVNFRKVPFISPVSSINAVSSDSQVWLNLNERLQAHNNMPFISAGVLCIL